MRRPRQIRRLVLTSVDHEDVVPVAEQLVDERPADEPGAALTATRIGAGLPSPAT
jgi:hypothetical protein